MRNLISFLLTSLFLSTVSFGQSKTFSWTDTTFTINSSRSIKFLINPNRGYFESYYADNGITIDTLVTFLNNNPKIKIEIHWHSYSYGSKEYDNHCSNSDAEGLKQTLISKGINVERIKSIGLGRSQPIYTEKEIKKFKTKEEQMKLISKNNRVEIIITGT